MDAICIRVKELRKHLDMSQVEFAKNLGVTNAHISKIEKGGTVPSDALVKLISKEYGVNEHWLKSGTEPIFIEQVEDETEKKLTDSTAVFNRLLLSDSYALRGIAAELEFLFSNITDVEYLDEKKKMEYLAVVKNMLSIITQYNVKIKELLGTEQMVLDNVFDQHIECYKTAMEQCIDEYKNLIKYRI